MNTIVIVHRMYICTLHWTLLLYKQNVPVVTCSMFPKFFDWESDSLGSNPNIWLQIFLLSVLIFSKLRKKVLSPRAKIRHLGSRIRQSRRGELVFTNGSSFIRGTLRIRQLHIYLQDTHVLPGTHFSLDS